MCMSAYVYVYECLCYMCLYVHVCTVAYVCVHNDVLHDIAIHVNMYAYVYPLEPYELYIFCPTSRLDRQDDEDHEEMELDE